MVNARGWGEVGLGNNGELLFNEYRVLQFEMMKSTRDGW